MNKSSHTLAEGPKNSPARVAGRLLLLVLRLGLAGLFIWAATLKLQDPRAFLYSIKGFDLLPEHILPPLAFIVPWTEIVCAGALLLGVWSRGAALALTGMLLTFIGAILSAIVRKLEIECGCFGDYSFMCKPGAVGWCNIGQNAILIVSALPIILWGGGMLSIDSLIAKRCAARSGGTCPPSTQTSARPPSPNNH